MKFNVYVQASNSFWSDAETKQKAISLILKSIDVGGFEIDDISVSGPFHDAPSKFNVCVKAYRNFNVEADIKQEAIQSVLQSFTSADLEVDNLLVSGPFDEFS